MVQNKVDDIDIIGPDMEQIKQDAPVNYEQLVSSLQSKIDQLQRTLKSYKEENNKLKDTLKTHDNALNQLYSTLTTIGSLVETSVNTARAFMEYAKESE